MPVDPNRVEAIFAAVLSKASSEERASYLDEACAGDPELRQRVEALLKAHDDAGSFLEGPAAREGIPTDPPAEPRIDRDALSPSAEGPGTRIGSYKLLQQIGEGGMGVVYMAEQEQPIRRRVAVKIIKPGMDSGQVIARFEAERQALALMDHLNIARVLDAGATATGRPYFVMELVHGVPITRYCDENRLTPRERLELFIPVCQAIQHAHQKGIIHRDIKPTNVMVCLYDGKPVPKVIDFGVAKAIEQRLTERTLFTQYGTIVGTFEYMAPEQAEMSQLGVDTRSDLYALGVLLYELLTGTTPLEHKRLQEAGFNEILRMIKEEEPPRPSRRLSSSGAALATISQQRRTEPGKLTKLVRGELDWIVMRCLEKDRTRRYDTASGSRRDLQHYLTDEPVEACPPSTGYKLRKFARKYRAPLWVAATFLLLLALGVIMSTWQAIRATRAEGQANQERDAAATAEKEAAQQRDEARDANLRLRAAQDELRQTLYTAHLNLAQSAWEAGSVGQVLEILDFYRQPRSGEKDLRGWEWYYQDRLCHGDLRTLRGHTDAVIHVAFSPDGTRLASASSDRSLKVWEVATGHELRTLRGHTGRIARVAFSPDGTRLASASEDQTVRVWDVASGQLLRTLPGHTDDVSGVAFSPDGTRLASASGDQTVKLWDVVSGQELRTFKGHTDRVSSVKFSPDGGRLASGSYDRTLKLWEVASGQAIRTLRAQSIVFDVAFSPDGALLASACSDSTLKVWEVASGQEIRTLRGHTGFIPRVAFSPDGCQLASASEDGMVKLWEVASGREIRTLRGHTKLATGVAFSPDGSQVASASYDQTVKLWQVASGPEFRTLKGHTSYVSGVAFSPDGTRLASASRDRTVKLWEVASGQELHALRGHTGEVVAVAFSPDRMRLASASQDQSVKVWEVASGRELHTLRGHVGCVNCVAFSPDGTRLASACEDRTVNVWEVASGQKLRTLKGHTREVSSVAFSPDGALLASAGWDHTVRVWEVASGQEIRTLPGHTEEVCSVAFSPDGARLASGSWDQTVRVWEVSTGQMLQTLRAHTPVVGVGFSPDGSRLASAGDGTVKAWEVVSGRELRTLRGHSSNVTSVAFSPDGTRLVSASLDRTVKVWDARPLTPALQSELEARGLVELVCAQARDPEDVTARLRSHQLISESVRQQALAFVPTYWAGRIQGEASRLVDSLFVKPLLKDKVLAAIRADGALMAAVRQRAVEMAERSPENLSGLDDASLEVVRRRGQPAEVYRSALQQAEIVSRLDPQNVEYLTTLGMAQYRVGQYPEALETLTRADRLHTLQPAPSHTSAVAFLALTHHQLDHKEQAQAALARLREIAQTSAGQTQYLAQRHLREAELVFADKPVAAKK